MSQLYGHPDNIDAWVGLVLEARVAGGRVGVTTQCLLVDTFRRIRDGDRSVAASHWLTALLTSDL